MKNFEYQKELHKRKASFSVLTIILALSTPTLFSISKQANLSLTVQIILFVGLLVGVAICLNQKNQIDVKLEKIKSSDSANEAYKIDELSI